MEKNTVAEIFSLFPGADNEYDPQRLSMPYGLLQSEIEEDIRFNTLQPLEWVLDRLEFEEDCTNSNEIADFGTSKSIEAKWMLTDSLYLQDVYKYAKTPRPTTREEDSIP
jgi:hypothetical protein